MDTDDVPSKAYWHICISFLLLYLSFLQPREIDFMLQIRIGRSYTFPIVSPKYLV